MPTRNLFSNRTTHIAFSLACLYAVLVLLNFKTLEWPFGIIDSPIILAQAILYSPLEYFASPSKYQFLSYNNFTPWVTLSWDFDYTLFQLEPLGYRAHQLVSMAALLGVVYLVLYRITRSILNTTLFCFAIISLPATFGVIDDLVNRHYLEGMIFCLLSFLFADNYSKEPSVKWLILSVSLYALSIIAKEIFILLPGVLFFLFPGSLRRKILATIPYALTLLTYIAWRIYMLSGAGGYSSAEASLDLIHNWPAVSDITTQLVTSLFVTPTTALLMLALFVILLGINISRLSLATIMAILVGAAGVVLPLLALLPLLSVGFYSSRWLFAPSFGLLLCFSFLCSVTKPRALAVAVYTVVFACSALACYVRINEPTPAYMKGNGKVYKTILLSDPKRFLLMSSYSRMAAQGQAVWVYIAKLRNGSWGTMQVSDRGQLQYHDMTNKVPIRFGRRKIQLTDTDSRHSAPLDLIESGRYDAETDTLTLNLVDGLEGQQCFIYVFGENNGLLLSNADCTQWNMSYRELAYLTRMTGYELPDISIAIWTDSPTNRQYSRTYKLRDLIDLDTL
jgi:hypothetical protein